ncbi:hypothetical protein CLF_107353 [Clonorchis sinensis]|uniref:PDZ domain-containing protein n=1 Tax=Clonorchis sinensis TaxID=79923 RepID=G7YGM4_CLOSI|nr:hypothetical protein CLF_107353 [Clonorchis sinensis]
MSLDHTHGQPAPIRSQARCNESVNQPTDSQARSEDEWILSTAKIPKSLDGRLPDIDYSKMKMRNLDDLNDERILMEFDSPTNPITNLYTPSKHPVARCGLSFIQLANVIISFTSFPDCPSTAECPVQTLCPTPPTWIRVQCNSRDHTEVQEPLRYGVSDGKVQALAIGEHVIFDCHYACQQKLCCFFDRCIPFGSIRTHSSGFRGVTFLSLVQYHRLRDISSKAMFVSRPFWEIQLHRRSALTDQLFPLELKKKTSPNSENEDVIVASYLRFSRFERRSQLASPKLSRPKKAMAAVCCQDDWVVPPSDALVTQLGGPLRLGNQVLQINDTPVYNLAQAQELLRNRGNKLCVYVMRPSEKYTHRYVLIEFDARNLSDEVKFYSKFGYSKMADKTFTSGIKMDPNTVVVIGEVSLSVSTPSFGTKEDICFPNGLSVNQRTGLQVTRDLEHHKGQQSPTILFPHTVYTTRDRLARTIELQQRLLHFKLNKNGLHCTGNNQQLLPRTSSQRQDNFWSCLPSQANEDKRRSFNELLASTRNAISSSGVEPSSQWVLKRKTDGTKYITRRIINIYCLSIVDIISFKRGVTLRVIQEMFAHDPKTVNHFSLPYGRKFFQYSSKLTAKSPNDMWF